MTQIDLGQVVGAQGPQGIQGPQGAQGIQGPVGPAATINGVNALTIEAGANIDLAQEGGTATLSVPTDSTPTADSTKPVQSGGVLAALNNKANRNLLDNWYFVGGGTDGKFPINQRGQTSYTAEGYCIDRWKPGFGISLTLESGGIQISRDSTASAEMIVETLPDSLWEQIAGKSVTLSVLVNGKLGSVSFNAPVYLDQLIDFPEATVDNLLCDIYGIPSSNSCGVRFFSGESGTWTIQAVKLELGSQQTLAHQDEDGNWVLNEIPDYGEELAKCQRYYWESSMIFASSQNYNLASLICNVQFPVRMRTIPAITIKSRNGTAGILSDWTNLQDTTVIANVNTSNVVDDGFNTITTSGMTAGIIYAFKVVANAEL